MQDHTGIVYNPESSPIFAYSVREDFSGLYFAPYFNYTGKEIFLKYLVEHQHPGMDRFGSTKKKIKFFQNFA